CTCSVTAFPQNQLVENRFCVSKIGKCSGCVGEQCAKTCWPGVGGLNDVNGFTADEDVVGYIVKITDSEQECRGVRPVEVPTGVPALDASGKIVNIGALHIKDLKQVRERSQAVIWIKYSSKPGYFTRARQVGTEYYNINPVGKWIRLVRATDGEYYYDTETRQLKLRATAQDGDMITFAQPSGAIKIDDSSIRTRAESPGVPLRPQTPEETASADCNAKLTELSNKMLQVSMMKMTDPAKAKTQGENLVKQLEQFKKDCSADRNLVSEADKTINQLDDIIKWEE
ncbi:hypothetical protein KY345_05500, partial [Candidatus Woesearchaeota archaeon]|nr:hypothetical protein [Candidatus Woesearchaeota archaeon]